MLAQPAATKWTESAMAVQKNDLEQLAVDAIIQTVSRIDV